MSTPLTAVHTTPGTTTGANVYATGTSQPFMPRAPQTFADCGIAMQDFESLVLKTLLQQGDMTGHKIAQHLKVPFTVVSEILRQLKAEMLIAYKGAAPMGDFLHELTDTGEEKAQRWMRRSTFCGSAPVPLASYIDAVKKQSLHFCRPKFAQVVAAFNDLQLDDGAIGQIGQALTSGRGLLLYGPAGNGKTSIAERVIRAFGDTIWIPRTICVGGEIIRLFDSSVHVEVPETNEPAPTESRLDRRWVRIQRPAVIVGGELTLKHLEMKVDPASGIVEAPLHMKSNCGLFVIDDFGRQQVSVSELLNRWIIPLEKHLDHQTLPTGRQIQIPFEQMLVFSTNLEPKALVDDAFLRRIPFKLEIRNPREAEFRKLFETTIQKQNIPCEAGALDYLIEKHYRTPNRTMRYCHVRDLLEQIRCLCEFFEQPLVINKNSLDIAVKNYFAGW
jgi:predicted ATPase with chaperone activity